MQITQFSSLIQQAEQALAAKDYQRCHQACIAAIKVDARQGAPYFLLSILTFDHQNFFKALELIDRALNGDAANPRYLVQKSKILTSLNRHTEAGEIARRVQVLKPTDSFTLDTLGVVFSLIGEHEKAIPYFERACKERPENAEYHYNLASSLRFSGDFKQATAAFEKALSFEPTMAKAHYALATLKKQQHDTHRLPELETALSKTEDVDSRLQLSHAIAKTLEDLGDFKQSFQVLSKAKKAKARSLPYAFDQDKKIFAAASGLKDLSLQTKNTAKQAQQIFIVGLPRTGTTLLDRILSSHSCISTMGELSYFGLFLKQALKTPSPFVLDEETLKASPDANFKDLGDHYQQATERLKAQSTIGIDKMPLNFFYAPLLLKALPNARIICLRRHPMDTILSNYRQLFRTSFSYYNYTFSLENTARYYAAFDQLMDTWRTALPADRFIEVRYENIIADLEAESKRLLSFCGFDFEEQCLDFHKNASPTATASSVQVRQPLYSSSIGRWKKYGDLLDGAADLLLSHGIKLD